MTLEQQIDFIGTGWSFPIRVNKRGGIELARGERDVEQAIGTILRTPTGERRMRPLFGCAIQDLTFAPNDPTTHGRIAREVTEALSLWEPRIEVLDVDVQLNQADPSEVLIDIHYLLRATNERRNLVYPFYLIPGEE
jgi:phage baseplate assembly protein W